MDRTEPHGYDVPIDVEELIERCLGSIEFVDRILQKFHEHFEGELESLELCVGAQDAEGIVQVAHRMKGAAANAAAPALRERAAEIERLGRAGRLPEIPAQVAEMRERWAEFVERVESLELAAAAS